MYYESFAVPSSADDTTDQLINLTDIVNLLRISHRSFFGICFRFQIL